MSLKDKKVVIIGGSSGIGLASAKAAAAAGAYVLIAGRSQEKLHKALAESLSFMTLPLALRPKPLACFSYSSATIFTATFLDLGPSNSQNKTVCHVPRTSLPFSINKVWEVPTSVDLMWASEFPSPWVK